jgi:cytochrome c
MLALAALVVAGISWAQSGAITGIGRAATPQEIAAWDIDVRPAFKGLPKGSGSASQGMDVWETKCASCHGIFGESNQVFSPLVGGTTKDDVKTGRVARLLDPAFPGRTTLMKVSTVSTLWDYIHRAMPWNAPKSLSVDEVYAVTAFLLNLGSVLPDDYTLSDRNIAEVQKLLPNRNGMTTDHGLWPGKSLGNGGRPDVKAVACMKDCAIEPTVKSFLPDFARNAHGNLAEQNRMVGAQHGADTTKPAGAAPATAVAAVAKPADPMAAVTALTKKYLCTTCHGIDNKVVGPGFREIAKKYAGRADNVDYLAGKIVSGGTGVWGAIPMPPQTLSPEDAKTLARWVADGAKQ